MKRNLWIAAALLGLSLAAACTSGGGTPVPPPQGGPLAIVFAAASPSTGPSPLRVTLTANISGGEAPYFYAWDFSNDGSFDDFRNSIFLRTLSVQHDYFLLSGGAGNTVYQAVLRVRDSNNAEVTSAPVTVTVTPEGGLAIPQIVIFSNEQDTAGNYVLRTGAPVFFRPTVTGGDPPYSYEWDFQNDGTVDATIANTEYTYTNTDPGSVKTFVARLRVRDVSGQAVIKDTLVLIEGPPGTVPPPTTFSIILNANPPADANGVIVLDWDDSANNPELPLEPTLDLSVIVDTSQGGNPPFEYYWDFENDGAFDTQVVSPTIPFYDPVRRILVNPYLHTEKTKAYELRVVVIDSRGATQEIRRTIISNNQENSAGALAVSGLNGVSSGTAPNFVFANNPPQPYKRVESPIEQTDILYQVTASGGSGMYDWQVDIDGDGAADWPPVGDPTFDADGNGFAAITGSSASLNVPFGFHDDTSVPPVKVQEWPALGYYASNATVRALNPTTLQPTETFKVQLPVSLVRRDAVDTDGPALLSRREMVMGGMSDPAIAGANENYVPSRTIVIAGGMQGTTPIRDVQQIVQTFNEPAAADTLEGLATSNVVGKIPMNTPRGGAVGTTDGTDFFMIGGENLDNGILSSTENSPLIANGGWVPGGEIRIPGFYPLTAAGGTELPVAVGGVGPGFVFAGGLTGGGGSENVSSRLIFTDLSDAQTPQPAGIQLGFQALPGAMVTERYDVCLAFANSRIFAIGGRVASGRSVSTVEAYNLNTNQWENIASLREFRSGACAEVVNGVIYVHGGAFYPGNGAPGGTGSGDRNMVPTSEVFNPLTGVWSYTVGLQDTAGENVVTEHGDTCVLAGPGSSASLPSVPNQIWYYGGAGAGEAETNRLVEFTYLYTISPTP